MITTADKLNMVTWAFSILSVLNLLLIAISWYRKKRLSLFNKAAILIVLVVMASFADAYWIEPNWLKTEQVVIHDPELALVLEGIKVVQISDIFHERVLRYGQDQDVCEPRDRDHTHPDTLFQPARNHPPRNKKIAADTWPIFHSYELSKQSTEVLWIVVKNAKFKGPPNWA